MILKPIEGVIKRRQNTTPVIDLTSQKGYITALEADSLPNQSVTEAKNVKIVKNVRINDPMMPEVSHSVAPRDPKKGSSHAN